MNLPNAPTYTLGEVADLLSSGSAFSGMPRSQAMNIAQAMSMRAFSKGAAIVSEGAVNEGHLFLVVRGQTQISMRLTEQGGKLVQRRAGPGHLIGEVGFIDSQPHSATCTALTDVHVAVLERSHLVELMESSPLAAAQLLAGLLRLLAQRIRNDNNNLRAMSLRQQALQKQVDALRAASATLSSAPSNT
jgi:CRP/FNR family transcriptional regulator, cyclic AMP receptor protein